MVKKNSVKAPGSKKVAFSQKAQCIKVIAKTVKKIAKNVYVSESAVKSATVRVRRELRDWGLLSPESRMDEVEVIYGPWDPSGFVGIMGFYSFEDNNIHIPAVFPPALLTWYKNWYENRFMSDVLRHEFGHALAARFSKFFHDKRFRKAFGGIYGVLKVAEDGDESDYVSAYARKYTQEDFAETFMFFLKHKGVLPRKYAYREAVRTKWETVAAICADIARLKK